MEKGSVKLRMKRFFSKKTPNEQLLGDKQSMKKNSSLTNDTQIQIPENITGLSEQEVKQQVEKGNYNKEIENISRTTAQIIRDNSLTLFNFINLFLAVSVFLVGYPENALFFWVILVNTAIGVFQEIHAKRTIDQLSIVNRSTVSVVRENKIKQIYQEDIVLNDILFLTTGNQIPSDGKVLYTKGLEIDESLLTGESDNISKQVDDSVMSGSFVTAGTGFIQITAVGEDNFVAKLSREAKSEKQSTSELMDSLNLLIKWLTIAIIPIGLLLFWSQFHSTGSLSKAVLGVSGALISMIPEGLMLLTSVAFAVGAANLAKKKTLIQRLSCIETLARVDIICLDKTGTITDGTLSFQEAIIQKGTKEQVDEALSELMLELPDQNTTAQAIRKAYPLTKAKWQAENTIPFSSSRKWSGVTFEEKGSYVIGAPEFIYQEVPAELNTQITELNETGNRVLILASFSDELKDEQLPKQIQTMAILVLLDTIRENATETFSYFKDEEVTLKVISGDNPITVSKIAQKAGIQNAEAFVDMSKIDKDTDYQKLVEETTVFGRVTPYQKRELVIALKQNNHTTCMTGDGVNDILSLREADVSVAMASGSDAARAVADVVLLNSNFSSMIQVLYEGRRVINNIERVASMYMVKTIYSAILAVMFIFIALPYPFAPLQLTPINTLTVGIPSFILALRPSYERIKGNFLTNILKISVPGSITIIFDILLLQLIGRWFHLSHEEISTMCVLLTGCVGFLVLYRVARPLDLRKKVMIYLLFATFLSCFLFFGGFFMYTTLFNRNVSFYLPLILGSRSIFKYISLIMGKIAHQLLKYKGRNKRS